jgi:hypothetical protein
MMAINLNMAFISPPVGFSLFYLQSVAPPEVRTADIHKGALPFMVLQVIGLMLVMYVPETVTWLLQIFEFRDVGIGFEFLSGSFQTRLLLSVVAVAMVSGVWAVISRSRFKRAQARVGV